MASETSPTELTLNVGPQHPSTHGVFRVIVRTEGEIVQAAEPVIGYLHRCFEKLAEERTYAQVVPLVDRLDYAAAITNEWAYVRAVEDLSGIEVPERAEVLRVLVAELQRIASHLLGLGATANDLGATTAFLYLLRARERAFELFEELTGARLTYNYLRIGGVARDLPPGFEDKLRAFAGEVRATADEYRRLVLENRIFQARTQGVGVLPAELAQRLGTSGPVLRASGVSWDLRKNRPYSIYGRLEFEVPVGRAGDCYERTVLRVKELGESSRLLEQLLDLLPPGEIRTKVPGSLRPSAGSVYSALESPRGEVGVYLVSDGGPKPYRLKWQAPSFNNLQVLSRVAPGQRLADLVAILGSLDPLMGEVER
ncbi:MAG TPA: NADH-quinone oxidoreductase subunit D [Firmicutes bacterium]|nr:NADH-quinone oxidoreductase subunit D [Bacillota bacterium]